MNLDKTDNLEPTGFSESPLQVEVHPLLVSQDIWFPFLRYPSITHPGMSIL